MGMTAWHELLLVLGSFIGATFALARASLGQHRRTVERLVEFLDSSMRRAGEREERYAEILRELGDGIRENTRLLERVAERLRVAFAEEGERWA